MTQKYPIGTKVIPIKKSIGVSLIRESRWKKAKSINQPFLYVTGYYNDGEYDLPHYRLSERDRQGDGNNWYEEDFIPFDKHAIDTLFVMLVEGKIQNQQYEDTLSHLKTHNTNTTLSEARNLLDELFDI